jgi:molybdopterin converting factor small subunit
MTAADIHLAEPARAAALGAVRVLFFGRVADACGRSIEVTIPHRGCSLTDLKGRIATQVEGGQAALDAPGLRVAIDRVMTAGDPWVSPGQDVAFLSVFSGG